MPDKKALLSAINKAEAAAYGSDTNGDLATIRARSIEDYLGEPYGDEVEGQSQVVTRDVFDTIESIKPSLARIFTGGERVCKFDPVGPEDEEQAEQESDYINHVIQEKNDWFRIFIDWISDALLTKNAYAMAYFDKSVDVESEKYFGLTPDELALLLQDPEVELVGHSEYPDASSMDPMAQASLHDVEIKRTKHKGQVKLCVLPPERVKIDENTPSFSVKGANYFEYWDYKTLSEIKEMGLEFDPENKAAPESMKDTPEDEARDNLGESGSDDVADKTMAKYKVRMIWIRCDYNEDGLAEMNFCIRVDSEILHVEECNTIPVASIVPTPLPHRHMGLSTRDTTTDLQRINTVLWRQTLNNMYLANNGRYGVSSKVNLDDMLVSRAGGLVRVDGIPSQEIFPFQHPFIAQHAIGVMDRVDQMRENRTGTNRYFSGNDQGSINKTASGIAQLSSAASQRVEMVARVFAEGVKELFQIVHELTIKHADATKQDKIRLRGKWVAIDPSTWKKRADLKISVGLGTGNKEVTGVNLSNILLMQEKALQIGVTTPEKIYNALTEVTKNYGFPNPDAFWQKPPEGPMPPPPDPNAAELEKAAIQSKTEIEKENIRQQGETGRKQMELAATREIEGVKIGADFEKTQLQANVARETKGMELNAHSSIEDKKLQAGAQEKSAERQAQDPLKQFTEAAMSVIEKAKASKGDESMSVLMEGMQAMIAAANAPREVVRGADGSILGTRPA